MPAGFRGSYADHVIELGIKRALRNKTQKAKKLEKKKEGEFSNFSFPETIGKQETIDYLLGN